LIPVLILTIFETGVSPNGKSEIFESFSILKLASLLVLPKQN